MFVGTKGLREKFTIQWEITTFEEKILASAIFYFDKFVFNSVSNLSVFKD